MLRSTTSFTFLALLVLPMSRGVAQEQKLPDGEGKDVFVRTCGGCHGPQIVIGRGNTEDGWTQVVLNMIQRGAQGTENDFAYVVQYLSTNFPPAGAKVNVNTASAGELKTHLALTPEESQSIVAYREHNGLFKTVGDLKKVPGINPEKIDAKKRLLIF